MNQFDPYQSWLHISPQDQPPNLYQLLGLDEFESNPVLIEGMAKQRIGFLLQLQTPEHYGLAQRLISEINNAKKVLLDPQLKRGYDAVLHSENNIPTSANPPPASSKNSPLHVAPPNELPSLTAHLSHETPLPHPPFSSVHQTNTTWSTTGPNVTTKKSLRPKSNNAVKYILISGIPTLIIATVCMFLINRDLEITSTTQQLPPPSKVLPLPSPQATSTDTSLQDAGDASEQQRESSAPPPSKVVPLPGTEIRTVNERENSASPNTVPSTSRVMPREKGNTVLPIPEQSEAIKIGHFHDEQYRDRNWQINGQQLFGRIIRKRGNSLEILDQKKDERISVLLSQISPLDLEYVILTSSGNEPKTDASQTIQLLPEFNVSYPEQTAVDGELTFNLNSATSDIIYYSISSTALVKTEKGINLIECHQLVNRDRPVALGSFINIPANFAPTDPSLTPVSFRDVALRCRLQKNSDNNITCSFTLNFRGDVADEETLDSKVAFLTSLLRQKQLEVEDVEDNLPAATRAAESAVSRFKASPSPSLQNAMYVAIGFVNKLQKRLKALERTIRTQSLEITKLNEVKRLLTHLTSWDIQISLYHSASPGSEPTLFARTGVNQEIEEMPDFPTTRALDHEFPLSQPGWPTPLQTLQFHKDEVLSLGLRKPEDSTGAVTNELISVSINGDSYIEDRFLGNLGSNFATHFRPILNSPTARMLVGFSNSRGTEERVELECFRIMTDEAPIDKSINDFLNNLGRSKNPLVSLSSQGNLLLACQLFPDNTIDVQLIDISGPKIISFPRKAFELVPTGLAVNDDCTFVLYDNAGHARIIRFNRENKQYESLGEFVHNSPIVFITFIDDETIISGDQSGNVIVFNVKTNQYKAKIKLSSAVLSSVSLSPDKMWLIIGNDKGILGVYSYEDLVEHFQLFGHQGEITDILFDYDQDRELLYTASKDKTIKSWNFNGILETQRKSSNQIVRQNEWDSNSAIGQVRSLLAQREFLAVNDQLATLSNDPILANTEPLKRLKVVAEQSNAIALEFETILKGFAVQGNIELEVGIGDSKRIINIIEVDANTISYIDSGISHERDRKQLTVGLAIAIYENFMLDTPQNAIGLAAYLASSSNVNEMVRQKANEIWQTHSEEVFGTAYPKDLMTRFLQDDYAITNP